MLNILRKVIQQLHQRHEIIGTLRFIRTDMAVRPFICFVVAAHDGLAILAAVEAELDRVGLSGVDCGSFHTRRWITRPSSRTVLVSRISVGFIMVSYTIRERTQSSPQSSPQLYTFPCLRYRSDIHLQWRRIALPRMRPSDSQPKLHMSARAQSQDVKERLLSLKQTGRVRLDAEEIDALAHALEGLAPARLALFGSRVEPDRRGGDVDLLILTDAPAYELSKRVATRFFSRCEERIDVVVLPAHGATPEQQAFLESIAPVDIA